LFDQTPVIEKEFGEPLTWDEKPGTRKSLISVSRHSFNPAIAGLSGGVERHLLLLRWAKIGSFYIFVRAD
jgi:hypothetical protein